MSKIGTKRLYAWQREYAASLRHILRTKRVALVQLPTGAGKTAIVLAALTTMKNPPQRILIGMPRRPHAGASPWHQDLKLDQFRLGSRRSQLRLNDGRLVVVSHRDLSRRGDLQLMRYRPGQTHSRGFHSDIGENTVVILDEVHRAKRLLTELERFRPLGKTKTVKLILVSATPVNPVRIHDARATVELSESHLEKLEDKAIRTGYLRLYKSLASVARGSVGDVRALEEAASLEDVARALADLEWRIRPIPRIVQMRRHHAPIGKPRLPDQWTDNLKKSVPEATRLLVDFVAATGKERPGLRRATAERFAIAGCLSNGAWKKVFGREPFAFPIGGKHIAFHGRYAADSLLQRMEVATSVAAMRYKLLVLEKFLRSHFKPGIEKGRVLVFCRYRRTVWWVSAWLEARRKLWMPKGTKSSRTGSPLGYLYHDGGRRLVWDTETYSRHGNRRPGAGADTRLIHEFNTRLSESASGAVLVTSDRLSESVDLHGGCGTMVHFDLDWSPLRMMQRVGRLWRHSGFLENGDGRRSGVPPFPAVFHLRYPCSTDDEIFSRLLRRWRRLSELGLGLDFISFESCLGREIGVWRERSDELLEGVP